MAKGKVIEINMGGVSSSVVVAEGDHPVEVVDVTHETSESSGKPYLKWKMRVVGGEYEGSNLYHNTSLQPQALFNLKNVLISLGVSVPNAVLKLDLASLVGKRCMVTVAHETYDGKKRARVVDFFPLSEDSKFGASSTSDDEEEASDFDSMSAMELIGYAMTKGISLSDLSPEDRKNREKLVAIIKEAEEI